MMLQSVLEPVVLGLKPDQDAGGLSMTCDHDLLGGREPQIAREIVLHFGECDLTALLR